MLIIVKIWELLTHQQKSKAFVLFFLVLIGGVFESIGLGMILPLIGLMTQPEVILNHSFSEPIVNLLGRPNPEEAFFIVLGSFTALYIIIAIYRLWLTWFQSSLMTNIKMSIASRLFEAYLYQPWTFHLKKHSSSLIQNINKEVDLLAQYGLGGGVIIMRDCIMIIVVMSVFIIASPIEMLTLLILFAPFIWGFQWLSKFRTRKWAGLRQQEERERLKCLQESMGAVKELRLLNCENLFFQKFTRHSDALARVNILSSFMRALPRPVFETLAIISMSVVIISMWLSGKELAAIAPIVGLFAIGVIRLLPAINSVLSSIHGIRFVAPSVDIVHKEFQNSSVQKSIQENKVEPLEFNEKIELNNISYKYEGTTDQVLHQINMKIPQGAFVAILGKTGSGKSTLLHILLGLLEPSEGFIKLDGKTTSLNSRSWQKKIGYIGQNIVMLDDTLRRNIAMGVPDEKIDEDLINQVVALAQLSDYVSNAPNGLDTIVGENAARISGGEKQRIGIARALYANASVLILDEITSALDDLTEASIIDIFEGFKRDKTIIMVTHKKSTVAKCDKIFELNQGQIVER